MFLLDSGVTYLNHGAFGACPGPVMRVLEAWQRELERQPVDLLTRRADALLEESSERLADYVGAEHVVLVPNATYGMNMVARSLPLAAGDRVLITDHEYGAVERLWELVCERAGATLVRCALPVPLSSDDEVLDAFEAELDERVRVVSLSHVTSPTGLVLPAAQVCALAREAGALSVVDGAHGPGQLDLELSSMGCDFYVGNCHKWLCGPKVAGFLYTRPGVEIRVDPLVVSWGWDEPELAQRAQWQGTQDLAAYLSIPAAIDFVTEHDTRARCVADAAYLHARLLELPGVTAMGDVSMLRQMVSVSVPPGTELPADIEVPIGEWRDRTLLRASVAMYNDRADLDRLVDALRYATAR